MFILTQIYMKKHTSQKQISNRFIYDTFTVSNVSKTSIDNLFERLKQSSGKKEYVTVPDQNYSQNTRTTRKKINKNDSLFQAITIIKYYYYCNFIFLFNFYLLISA